MTTEPSPPRERTGRHFCARCFKEIPADEYFAGDFYCLACAEREDDYPLATTPEAPDRDKK